MKDPNLKPVKGKPGLYEKIKDNGIKYTVRADRNRYFFPDEWKKFRNCLKDGEQKLIFDILLQTGARIDEALHLTPSDIHQHNNTITLRVTKVKSKKGESKTLGGKKRNFSVDSKFMKRLKKYIKENNIQPDERIIKKTKQGVFELFKRKLKKANLPEWEFSLHNIRKTHGMWLKTVQRRGEDLDMSEICMRLGHDYPTFLNHYGSPSIFTDQDRDKIIDILGDIYKLR